MSSLVIKCPVCTKRFQAYSSFLNQKYTSLICDNCRNVFDAKKYVEYHQQDIFSGPNNKVATSVENPKITEFNPNTFNNQHNDAGYDGNNLNDTISPALDPDKYQVSLFSKNNKSRRIFNNQTLLLSGVALIAILFTSFVYWFFQENSNTGKSRAYCVFNTCINENSIDLTKYYEITGDIKISPKNTSALIANIELYNKHNIALPLPNIVVYFTNNNGFIEAGREFQPDTYLGAREVEKIRINGRQRISFVLNFMRPNIKLENFELRVNNP